MKGGEPQWHESLSPLPDVCVGDTKGEERRDYRVVRDSVFSFILPRIRESYEKMNIILGLVYYFRGGWGGGGWGERS